VLGRRLAARYIGWGEIIVGLAESNGSLMASVTCGLTAEDWDQLRNGEPYARFKYGTIFRILAVGYKIHWQ